MTVLGLVSSLAWSVVVLYAIRAFDQLRRAELDAYRAKHADDVAVADRHEAAETERVQLTLAAQQRPDSQSPTRPSTRDIQLPDDLEAHVMTWQDEWARDDERGNIRAKYLEFHTGDNEQTWQRVRRACGIGELPG